MSKCINCIQEELAQFKRVLNLTHDTIFIFNDDTLLFEYANRGALNQVGYSMDEIMKMTPVDINPYFTRKQFETAINPLRRGEQESLIFSTIHTHKSGKEIPVDIVLTHSMEDNKFVAIVRDASNRIATEVKLKQSEQEALRLKKMSEDSLASKTLFFARMSHEIRTPMNGIIGFSELLLNSSLTNEQFDHASQILDSASSLRVILNDILDISKLESGKLALETVEFNYSDIICDSLKLFKDEATNKGIELTKIIPPDLPKTFIGDPIRLKQVFLNLLSNAVKFTSTGKVQVEVSFKKIKDDTVIVRTSVLDTGIGIRPQELKNIFNDFIQADISTTRKYGGTGLGISISKGIVVLMGGSINVSSKINEGSCFVIEIPFTFTNRPRIKQATNIKIVRNYNKSVILAEDNLVNQMLAIKVLKMLGLTVHVANNGQEAIDLSKNTEHELILMDIQMPVLNGIKAAKQLFSNGYAKPIIAMTADVSEDNIQEYQEIGFSNYIPKPYVFKDLISVLDQYLLKKD